MFNHSIFHSTRKSEFTKVSEPNLTAMMLETSPLTSDTRTCCRALGGEDVTTCFYDLGLSRRRSNPMSRMRAKRSTTEPPAAVYTCR